MINAIALLPWSRFVIKDHPVIPRATMESWVCMAAVVYNTFGNKWIWNLNMKCLKNLNLWENKVRTLDEKKILHDVKATYIHILEIFMVLPFCFLTLVIMSPSLWGV